MAPRAVGATLVLSLVFGACSSLAPPQQATIDTWLLCQECDANELDSVATIGDAAVGYLAKRLSGPPPDRLENVRLQVGESYRRMVEFTGPAGAPVSEEDYVRRYLESYIETYQIRSAIALGRIGTTKAHRTLRNALAWDTLYGADVLEAIRDALASNLVIEDGNSQAGAVGTALPVRPSVRVVDARNKPVGQVPVTFAVASGGGALTDATGLTDAAGRAVVGSWTLGPAPGEQTLRAFTKTDTVLISAAATPSPVAIVTANSALAQAAPIGLAVPAPLSVRVTDGAGSPVGNAVVTFTVVSGGGNVTGGVDTTDADGTAALTRWVLGDTIGVVNRVEARGPPQISGISPAEVVTFSATGTRPPPDSLRMVAGDGQTAIAGNPVDIRPAVLVTDASGHLLSGVAVAFSVTTGGGSISGGIQTTSGDGVATVGSWTLGPRPGPNQLRARVIGLPGVTFNATATARSPTSINRLSGDGQLAPVGMEVAGPPAVIVTDGGGNPVPGVTVSFAVVSGGGSVTGDAVVTDSGGRAVVGAWRLGPAPGEQRVRAAVAGVDSVLFRDTATVAFLSVSAGGAHTCAVSADSVAYCWGRNARGQLGDNSLTPSVAPVPVAGDHRFREVAAGLEHTCGVSTAGTVYCWGANDHGQLGVDDFDDRIVPTAVDGSQVYGSVAVGAGHTCADSVGGAAVFCWGADSAGQLGDGPTVLGSSVPQRIPGLFAVRSLAVGSFHGCADSVGNGGVYCWGENQSGQLGVGPTAGSEIPLPIQPGHSLVRVTAGGQSTCALTAAGKAFCWGGNASGQLGVGDRATRVSPVPVASPIRFTALTVGFRHACGLTRRVAYCWGKNEQGQLGNGETDDALSPARVIGFRFQSVSAGGDHTCGITLRAEIYCWGRGDEGQLGLGAPVARATRPARVRHPL